jgi:hypothetical protein
MASKKKAARKKAIRKTIRRLNASVSLIACTGESTVVPLPKVSHDNQRLEPCARQGCDSLSQVGDRLCKRHRIAMEESRARHR